MLVRVGRYEKSVFALQEAPSEFIADPIGLFRRDLARLEGLAYLIGDHIALLCSSGELPILALGKQKFHIRRLRVTGEGGHKFSGLRLVRIDRIFCPV